MARLTPPLPTSTGRLSSSCVTITPAAATTAMTPTTATAATTATPTAATTATTTTMATTATMATTFIERAPMFFQRPAPRTHSSSLGNSNTILFGGSESMLIDQDVVPGHSHHRTSVLHGRGNEFNLMCFPR